MLYIYGLISLTNTIKDNYVDLYSDKCLFGLKIFFF